MTSILVVPHIKKCSALKNYKDGQWATPWGLFTDKILYGGNLRLNKRGNHKWLVARCNNISCHAEVAVLEDSILFGLPPGREVP